MVLVDYCDEKIRYKLNLILSMLSGFSLYQLKKRKKISCLRWIGKSPLPDFSGKIEGDSAHRVWLVMNEMSFAFWSSSWVSSEQMGRDIFFRLQRVTWYCCFSQRVNSNTGHKSSLLVLTFTKYLEVAIVLCLYANVTRYFYLLLQRVTWHPCLSQGRKFNERCWIMSTCFHEMFTIFSQKW